MIPFVLAASLIAQVQVNGNSLGELGQAGLTVGVLVGGGALAAGFYTAGEAIAQQKRPSDLVLAFDYLIATVTGAGGAVMLALSPRVDDPTGRTWLLVAGGLIEGLTLAQLCMTIAAHAQPARVIVPVVIDGAGHARPGLGLALSL